MNIRWLALMVPAVLLSACGGSSMDDIQEWMREEGGKISPSIAPLPNAVSYRPVAFDMKDRLDPFDTNRLDPGTRREGRRSAGGWTPDFEAREMRNFILEKYPLESMSLIGILHIKGQKLAAIKVDDRIQQVKVGDYIGLDFGLITDIGEGEISLKESVEDSTDGVWTERMKTLYLQTKEEGR
jgi:type IV pilus assembly protein PilP